MYLVAVNSSRNLLNAIVKIKQKNHRWIQTRPAGGGGGGGGGSNCFSREVRISFSSRK